MYEKSPPQGVGLKITKPISFPDENELCKRLDEFYKVSGIKPDVPPSQILLGALCVLRQEHGKQNPDWMSQVAHSLREILYQFNREKKKRKHALKQFGYTYDEKKRDQDISRYYGLISDIAHHNYNDASKNPLVGGSTDKPVVITRHVFENVVSQFGRVLYAALRRQLDAHQEIDRILEQGPNDTNSEEEIELLININADAQQYFFAKANERWLEWLWNKGFLEALKRKAEDTSRYGYRTPELNYVVRMAESKPKEVANIILAVPISKEKFNPEAIDQFSRICGELPAEQLSRIVPKIRNDGWVRLMSSFTRWGMEYEKMFHTLDAARDYDSLLTLADAVLSVRTTDEMEQLSQSFHYHPFYLNLSYTRVFEHLVTVDREFVEQALVLVLKVITNIALLEPPFENNKVFPIGDMHYLLDVDFFSLTLSKEKSSPDRDDVQELVATMKLLTERCVDENRHKPEKVRELYQQHINLLPQNRSMWRLRLFVLSLHPTVFQEELKQSFSKLFEVMDAGKPYYEIESGAEYKKALRKSFVVFDQEFQRTYVENIFKYFGKHIDDKEREPWHKRDGWQILSSISEHLTEEEYRHCEKIFGAIPDPTFEPTPAIGKVKMHEVKPRGPISQEEFGNLSIDTIAQNLTNEWSPEALQKQDRDNDTFNPLNAEGVGGLLRTDIGLRFQDYIQNASLFFKRDILDEHYTYSFLRGIQETLRADATKATNIRWDGLVKLLVSIKQSGETNAFDCSTRERNRFSAWLSSWTSVHSAMADVLQELFSEHDEKIAIEFSKYRDEFLDIINYLLKHPDPEPKNEELETATMKMGSAKDKKSLVSDPFSMAINTVRGRTFQAFVLFMYQDRKRITDEEGLKISSDVKNLYEKTLKAENTRALMFMFGYYLPSFYFRSKEWIQSLLPIVFPEEQGKNHLYIAAWEGYLSTNLYEDIFFDPAFQKLYQRGLALTGDEDPTRNYHKDLEKGISDHLALAFIFFYKKFGFEHMLFQEFWKQNTKQRGEFVNFIGRAFISGDDIQADKLLKKEPESKERLLQFWQWLLKNFDDPNLFSEFGFWINLKKLIFDPTWLAQRVRETLEKSKGILDWDHGLNSSILQLAVAAPMETLGIARLYLLEGGVRGGKLESSFFYDDEWTKAINVLYNNPETKQNTYLLINDLIKEGGSMFWKLKAIIEKS